MLKACKIKYSIKTCLSVGKVQTSKFIIILFVGLFGLVQCSEAAQYFYYDAESGTVGNNVPTGSPLNFYASPGNPIATVQSSGGAGQGSKYFQWDVPAGTQSIYTEVTDFSRMPFSPSIGSTYYLAAFFRVDRIGGAEVFSSTETRADKYLEFDGTGTRWLIAIGSWISVTGSVPANHYTVWISDPASGNGYNGHHCGASLPENDSGSNGLCQANQNGYSPTNPVVLDYETWNSVVMGIKLSTSTTGSATMWVNGVKVSEALNIQTAEGSGVTIDQLEMLGTVCQNNFDCPSHVIKTDAVMLTDSWTDIVNGGYATGGGGGDTTPPAAPSGLSVS